MSTIKNKQTAQKLFNRQILIISLLLVSFNFTGKAQQVSEVITDFGGYWKSTVGALNPTYPNTSHNVLCFKYNSVSYSTGVNDALLTSNSINYALGDYRAFPVGTVGGTITSGASIYIALASRYDGVANGYSNPLPSLKIKDVLIDGQHGLDIGTGATNIPASALVNFPISAIISSEIADAKPDILVSQIAQPTSSGDTLYFINSLGAVVGSKVSINWTTISNLGTYYLDLYSLPNGALCDTARISGTFDKETTREIRLAAYKISDFGITIANAGTVASFILKASGTSDPAFIAYNTDAFIIPAPIITLQPISRIVCPNVSNSTTLTVAATGGSLTYQWKKNNVDIPSATGTSYTVSNVLSASAGTYTVLVSNPVGSVLSDPAYLNISISTQPSPSTQLIATGAACTISVLANNATSYQWRKAGVDIAGANSSTLTIPQVTSTAANDYSVQVINSASAGCANLVSNIVTITGSTVLYSKTGVDLNLPGTWGVATNGTGSSPVDFTRSEHTFVVRGNAVTAGNLTIAGTLDVASAVTTISANTTLDAGSIIRTGSGSIAVSPASSLTVRGNSNLYFTPGSAEIKNLKIYGGTINLNSTLSITAGAAHGTLTLSGGIFNTNGNLTLKSNASGTADLAAITGGAAISGAVTLERYIPAARGWRLLSVPISATGAPTINQSWQEAVTTASGVSNPYPGYGGQITGGTTANGFDQSSTNSPSIKIFDYTQNTFLRLPASPGTNIPITNYPAYFLYLRGDRGINLMQGLAAAITSTTLRMKGQLKTGDQAININANNFTLVGNPFPSAIDFGSLTKNNIKNTMYVWDPKLAGTYGLGGYVTVSYNSSTGNYDKTASSSPVSKYIASGEAFFVSTLSNAGTGTLTIKEADKTSSGSDLVYRQTGIDRSLRVNLYSVNASDSAILLDGNLTTYDEDGINNIDEDDALKLNSSNENLGIKRDGTMLAIERRKLPDANDTTFLNIYQVRIQNYKLEIVAAELNSNNCIAFLKDSYLPANNDLPLNLNGTTTVAFSINSDPASYNINRFSIVFEKQAPLPLKFISINAKPEQKNIRVSWNTANELNVKQYEVERAADGILFTKINTEPAKNAAENSYSSIDISPLNGSNYYRIRAVDNDAKTNYSDIVKVLLKDADQNPSMDVIPNPVTGNFINIQVNHLPQGNYQVQLYNLSGQMISSRQIEYNGTDAFIKFEINDNLTKGKYNLQLSGSAVKIIRTVIK